MPPDQTEKKEFPEEEVRAVLTESLLQLAQAKCLTEGLPMPTERATALTFRVAIDSLGAVDTICEIEDIVSATLEAKDLKAKDIVRPGGYACVDEALKDMVPKVRKIWEAKAAA